MLKNIFLSILTIFYSMGVAMRHMLFDWGILKTNEYDIPIICIGNITVGGTGKTPMSEMIVRYMSKHYNIAVLSRGYGRKTKGYIEVEADSHYRNVGDEPLQIKLKFPDAVVVVCEKRSEGVERIRKEHSEVNLIIMDDGFQHRYVEAKVNVIMVDATRPPQDDKMLPLGRLRDNFDSLHRAHFFIVTKCPENMAPIDRRILHKVLVTAPYQDIYFTRIESFKPVAIFPNDQGEELRHGDEVIAMSGIGNPTPFINGLNTNYKVVGSLIFDDHHVYKVKDIKSVEKRLKEHPNAKIITTEKDAVKMVRSNKIDPEVRKRMFYVPINISFIDDSKVDFLQKLHDNVIKN